MTDTNKQGTISCHIDLSVELQKIGGKKFTMLLAILCKCRAVVFSCLALAGFFRVFSELDRSILVYPVLFPHFSCKWVVCWSYPLERDHPKVAHTVAFHVEMSACRCTEHLVLHIASMLVEPCLGLPLCFANIHP